MNERRPPNRDPRKAVQLALSVHYRLGDCSFVDASPCERVMSESPTIQLEAKGRGMNLLEVAVTLCSAFEDVRLL